MVFVGALFFFAKFGFGFAGGFVFVRAKKQICFLRAKNKHHGGAKTKKKKHASLAKIF
jgi:hypothetical protein